MIKKIFCGTPDQGKSYMTATECYIRLLTCKLWWEKGIIAAKRFVAVDPTVMKLSPWVEKKFGLYPDGYLRYYDGLKELSTLRQCDVFLDDMGTQFSARRWSDMPSDIMNWFRLMGHYECDVYGNAQDFLDIDISIRRKARNANVYMLHKLIGSPRPGDSYPPIKFIWGIIVKRRMHYSEMDKEMWKQNEARLGLPTFIRKFNCSIYDTLQDVKKSQYPPYECIERECTNPEHKDRYGVRWSHFQHI